MKGQQVQLSTDWLVGERIGEGGFGRVYLAVGGGREAVIKFVPKVPGAQRELLLANPDDVRNVIPILDSGEHGDYWVLVMPRAERSLRSRLAQESPLPLDEAVTVISDVCDALVDLDGKVVHRDLKPDNILFYDGAWCLADFGISRYAEASTASDTRKYSKTPHYAAPEQWRNERATTATDMYALGIMAFEMIVGHRPFPGPSVEDFREQHLHGEVPDLPTAPAGLAALIDECLYKAPAARPTPANFGQRLDQYIAKAHAASGGLARLEEANKAEVRRRSAESRQPVRSYKRARTAKRSDRQRNEELYADFDRVPRRHYRCDFCGCTVLLGRWRLVSPVRRGNVAFFGFEPERGQCVGRLGPSRVRCAGMCLHKPAHSA
ncbi:serine/threonine protein kinase [Nocardia farcinica]|uniref:serine/threonine-protein kinase n=1 Tax=Nocardia farcinica TaxID=37329 RepID=UPI0018933B48|nr:serine/threonine-protein kinase [Nocardia farcinica]MBF6259951.1 serine/threonine protein kinase [Nocardia farcinica]